MKNAYTISVISNEQNHISGWSIINDIIFSILNINIVSS